MIELLLLSIGALLITALLWVSVKTPIVLLFTHVLSRILLDSIPDFTYGEFKYISGITLMELYTAGFIIMIIIVLVFRAGLLRIPYSLTIGLVIIFSLLSSTIFGSLQDFVTIGFRWIYLLCVLGLTLESLKQSGMKTVIVLLSLAFVYAPANQLAYIFTHPPSYDNGISYRGSFDHESNLGFLLVGMIPIILILKNITNNKIFKWLIFGLFLYLHIGIILNNYRTATLGLLVFWVIVFLYRFKSLSQVKKVGYISASFVFMLTAFVLFADRIADMFGDIYLIVSNPGLYFDFTGNAVPNKLMSGRIDIINTVMSVYIKSDIEQLLLGLGPSAINNIIGVYAHNEFISALVETGIIGFIVFSVVLITIIKRCNRVIKYDSIYALPAGSAVFAIIFMCLATMPFRNMRALMVVGVLLAIVEYSRYMYLKKLKEKGSTQ